MEPRNPSREPEQPTPLKDHSIKPVTDAFEVIFRAHVPELSSEFVHYRHRATGSDLFSFVNSDPNKTFAVGFKTPVSDSKGAPHIVEHTVLCGSKNYPVPDPFLYMLKSSLSTFLNAYTGSDRTFYPVASTNVQDFYNLVGVYVDAVFYPLLSPDKLKQEGWRFDVDNDGKLIYGGIVYNEMKGAYSEPDSRFYDAVVGSLFPDTAYRFDSGGNPAQIPSLTWEQFRDYHSSHYHPSNALFFFYGDDDPLKRLELVDSCLAGYKAQSVDTSVPLQPPFAAPRTIEDTYPSGELGAGGHRDFVSVNWGFRRPESPVDNFGIKLLDHILTGTEGAPLKRALIQSGLGEGIALDGIDDSHRELMFGMGLKNCSASDTQAVEAVVLNTLQELVRTGIPVSAVIASINLFELRLREFDPGNSPRGLEVFERVFHGWQYGQEPLSELSYEAPLAEIRRRIASGERYFEGLIENLLLNNPHRTTLALKADPEQSAREEAAERAVLDLKQAVLNAEGMVQVRADAVRLKELQQRPATAEALATLPVLKIADVDSKLKPVPQERAVEKNVDIFHHPLPTNGLAYLDIFLDIRGLAVEALPMATFLAESMFKLGTRQQGFMQQSERIATKTGGVKATPWFSHVLNSPEQRRGIVISGKALAAEVPELLAITEEALSSASLDDRTRVLELAKEYRSTLLSGVRDLGHHVVLSRLASGFDPLMGAFAHCKPMESLMWLEGFIPRIEKDWDRVSAELMQIRDGIFNRSNAAVGVTATTPDFKAHKGALGGFLAALPASGQPLTPLTIRNLGDEALTVTSDVFYVGKALPLAELGYKYSGAMELVTHYLNTGFLWDRVRVQGGAYGSFSAYDRHTGVFSMVSYRDPKVAATVDVYDAVSDHLSKIDLSPADLEKLIIGATSIFDPYQLPRAKGATAFRRTLAGITDGERQRAFDELLATTVDDIRRIGGALSDFRDRGRIVVLGDPSGLGKGDVIPGRTLGVTKIPE